MTTEQLRAAGFEVGAEDMEFEQALAEAFGESAGLVKEASWEYWEGRAEGFTIDLAGLGVAVASGERAALREGGY